MSARALVAVDVQNDFCEGGSLAVTGGAAVAAGIAEHVAEHRPDYATVVASRDWHIDPGGHFAPPGTAPDYRATWPVHCRADQPGSDLHPALAGTAFDAVFDKGQHAAAYSAFEGREAGGTALGAWLAERGVTEVDVCGLATDYCVRATALDAAHAGLRVRVLLGLSAAVAPESEQAALAAFEEAGVEVARG